jgi:molecular chaperone DnaK
MEALNKAWEGAAQEMYASAQGGPQDAGAGAGGPGGQPGGESAGSDGGVSDVEYEEVNDKDKK